MSSSTQITRHNLVEQLQITVPHFSINPKWLDSVLLYPIMNDLARFICNRAGVEDFEQVKRTIRFLEAGVEDGDDYVRDLVIEALETLAACKHVRVAQRYFGPRLIEVWQTVQVFDFDWGCE